MRTFLRCWSKWDKLLLVGMLLLVLSPIMKAQPYIDSVCVLTDYPSATGKEHAIYLNGLPNALGKKFVFDSLGGQMTVFSDSSIRITGTVVHKVDPTWQWDINMWLINMKDYATWDSLGRKAKRGAAPFNLFHSEKVNFDFYELDSTRSYLSGTPGTFFDGDTLTLTHMPANLEYGFQRGIAANGHTADYGMSGWFFFGGSYSGVGDLNVNISCAPPICDVAIDTVIANCVSDSTFELAVTVSGDSTYEIVDDQGISALSGVGAGTYVLGPYANNTPVNVFANNANIFACADSAGPFTLDCTTACDANIDSVVAVCLSDTTFEVQVTIGGGGTNYELVDDQGSAPQTGLSAGTYTFGPYFNNTNVTFIVTDLNLTACADTAAPVTLDCTPSACDVDIDSITTVCLTDTTFEVVVNVNGTGTYDLTDNLGISSFLGVNAGTYNFGPYANNASVIVYATDVNLAACADTAGPVSADCTPGVSCDVNIDSVATNCINDSTYQTSVTISGTSPYYFISDDFGTPVLGVPGAGTYTYGSYNKDSAVTIFVVDSLDATCADTLGPVQGLCVCDVAVDTIFALCVTDSSFEIVVEVVGIGSNYQIQDSEGNPPLTGLTAGTYMLGPYFNSTDVFVTVSDPNFTNCFVFDGPFTQDCTPVPICDVQVDTAYTNCIGGAFEVIVTISGSGMNTYKIFDDKGTTPLTGLNPGTYNFGNYPIGDTVNISVEDTMIFGCIKPYAEFLTDSCGSKPNETFVGIFYPNPTLGKSKIDIKLSDDDKIGWVLLDGYGNQINQGEEQMYNGNNTIEFKTSSLAPGLYILEVIQDNVIIAARKLIVIH